MPLLGGTLAQLSKDRNIPLADLQKLNPQANLNTTYSATELKFPTATAPTITPTPLAPIPGPTIIAPSPTGAYTGVSIVDYLKSVGQASDFTSRSKLATQYGITNYTGTAEQNTLLLNKLKGGPVPPAPAYVPPPLAPKPALKTGAEAGAGAGIGTVDNQAIIDNINAGANKDMTDALNLLLSSGTKVDTSSSAKLTEKLAEALGGLASIPAPEKPKSLVDLFAEQKIKLGIEPLETEMTNLDKQIAQLDADFSSTIETEENRLVSTREISRNLSDKEILYNRQKRDLLLQKNSLATQINNKMNTLQMIMNLTNQDMNNASDYYNQQFNKNVQLINLVSNISQLEITRQDKIRNDARANLTIVQNLFKDQNISYANLTDTQKQGIANLELASGLPVGITALISNVAPKLEIKATSSRTDDAGNSYYDVLMSDPKTGALTVKTIFKGKDAKSEDKLTPAEKLQSASAELAAKFNRIAGPDGFVDPVDYNTAKRAWVGAGFSAKDFDDIFQPFRNPFDPKYLLKE